MLNVYCHELQTGALRRDVSVADLPFLLEDPDAVVWADLIAPTPEELSILTDVFFFSELCVEDCVHPQRISKLEEYPNHLFLVVHGVKTDSDKVSFEPVELAVFLGKNFLVTVHSEPQSSLDFVRTSLLRGTSSIHLGAAALAHEIFDALVDQYTPVLDAQDKQLQRLEEIIQAEPTSDIIRDFFDLRRSILELRRISLREQEVLYWLGHRDIPFIKRGDKLRFKDIHDHLVRIVELSEASRDILSGILAIHQSLVSNRTNDIMKLLTMFSAILLPLTFVVGVYGMNFDNIPELHHPWGYHMVLAFMTFIVVGMLGYFRYKRWL